jgi:16S rRNA G966 N2-methylase RsmD
MANIRLSSETDTILHRLQNSVIDEKAFIIARNPIQPKSELLRKPIQIASETVAGKTTIDFFSFEIVDDDPDDNFEFFNE